MNGLFQIAGRRIIGIVCVAVLLTASPGARASDPPYEIPLRARRFTPQEVIADPAPVFAGPAHLMLQTRENFTDDHARALRLADVRVLHPVSNRCVVIGVPAGAAFTLPEFARWAGPLSPADKLADAGLVHASEAEVAAGIPTGILVEFFADVPPRRIADILSASGVEVAANPSLPPSVAAGFASDASVASLAAWDEVAWIVPAPEAVLRGDPVYYCPGAMTRFGPVPNFATVGAGWDGPGQGAAALTYFFVNGTDDIAGEEAMVLAAMDAWAAYAQLTFSPAASAGLPASIDISWVVGDHGDGSPFGGPGGIVAHAFYPSPPTGEPIAGDLHFDDAEPWGNQPGCSAEIVFGVALHELGHSLGLDHTGISSAVMFPAVNFCSPTMILHADDIAGIQSLYAAAPGTAPSPTPGPSPTATPTPTPCEVVSGCEFTDMLSANTTGAPYATFLGAPDDVFFGLGNGSITYALQECSEIQNRPGPDFNVYEVDFGAQEFAAVTVLVSTNGISFTDVTATAGPVVRIPGDEAHGDDAFARSFESVVSGVRFVRLQGTGASPPGSTSGFDADAIGIIHIPWSHCDFPENLAENTTIHPDFRFIGDPDESGGGLRDRVVTYALDTCAEINDLPGPDFNVYEDRNDEEEFAEVLVLVSADGVMFTDVSASAGPVVRIPGDEFHTDDDFARSYDLQPFGLGGVRFVRLQGTSADPGPDGGFDLDAMGVIHNNLAAADCNMNGLLDDCDISTGNSQDVNMNGVPDECEFPPTPTPVPPSPSPKATVTATATATPTAPPCCPGDADNSGGNVNANDFLAVQANFGANNGVGGLGDADCSGGAVNANDFLAVQANFGASCG